MDYCRHRFTVLIVAMIATACFHGVDCLFYKRAVSDDVRNYNALLEQRINNKDNANIVTMFTDGFTYQYHGNTGTGHDIVDIADQYSMSNNIGRIEITLESSAEAVPGTVTAEGKIEGYDSAGHLQFTYNYEKAFERDDKGGLLCSSDKITS